MNSPTIEMPACVEVSRSSESSADERLGRLTGLPVSSRPLRAARQTQHPDDLDLTLQSSPNPAWNPPCQILQVGARMACPPLQPAPCAHQAVTVRRCNSLGIFQRRVTMEALPNQLAAASPMAESIMFHHYLPEACIDPGRQMAQL